MQKVTRGPSSAGSPCPSCWPSRRRWPCRACRGASAKVVWLCKPGQHPDPCTPGLSTTVYSPTLQKLSVTSPQAVKHPKIDCFYVYPTVSDQKTVIANLHIDPESSARSRCIRRRATRSTAACSRPCTGRSP